MTNLLSLAISKVLRDFKESMAAYFPVGEVRKAFLRTMNVKIGRDTTIGIGTIIRKHVTIGDRCWIGHHVIIESYVKIGNKTRIESLSQIGGPSSIGDHVFISSFFFAANDNRLTYHRRGHGTNLKGVTIKDNVRIGAHVMTLSGVTIGEGAIVGGYTLVTRDVEPYTLVFGVPAHEHEDKLGLLEERVLPEFK